MKFSLKTAFRFLMSNKAQTFLIVLGIAVGISVQLFISVLIDSLQKNLIEKTIGNSPHITVTEMSGGSVENYNEIIDYTKKEADVSAYDIVTEGPFFVLSGSENISVLLRGISMKDSIYNIKEKIISGNIPENINEVIIGKDFSEKYNINNGDKINFLGFKGGLLRKSATVTGIFDFKVSNLNSTWILTNNITAYDFFGVSNPNKIEFQIKDIFNSDIYSENIKSNFSNTGIKVSEWKEQNSDLLSGLNGQSISSIMIQIFVIVAVALGIASVLIITVLQKSKQIGILKAMGLKNRQTSTIFIFEGLLLGFFGAVIGIAIGMFLLWGFSTFAVNPDKTPIVKLYFGYRYIIISSLVGILSSVISAIIPAGKSAKLDPVEVIRNG
ncbi:MAG TPA: FtsX-like permease family protein [Tepiditoga sp.]|nr:FtsX-like permease family protein [Tepiditoga sp.]